MLPLKRAGGSPSARIGSLQQLENKEEARLLLLLTMKYTFKDINSKAYKLRTFPGDRVSPPSGSINI